MPRQDLVDPRSVAFWPMNEQKSSFLPSDKSEHLGDLEVPAGLEMPLAVEGTPTGFGREFVRDPATGFVVTDEGGDLRLTRNIGIIGILRLDVEDLSDADICTIIQRGRGGGADPIAFGLRVVVVDASDRACRLEMYWQTVAGADVVDAGAEFTWPVGAFLMLGATREVEGGLLVVRYQVNGDAVDGEQDHALDCGGEDEADISLGAGMDGAAYENHWDGAFDILQVIDEAMAPQELLWLWQRLTIDQPAAVETMRRYVPPGGVYSEDPDSQIQRELAVEGGAFGWAKSLARQLRDYFFPDVAWGPVLVRWEALTGNPARPGDSIAQRQARVLDRMSSNRGPDLESYRERLAEAFDQDAADVELIEYGIDYTETFDADPENALIEEGDGVTWVIGSGELTADSGTGGADDKDLRHAGRTSPSPFYLLPLAGAPDAWIEASFAGLGDDAVGGIMLGRRDIDEWVWIGMRMETTTEPIVWVKYVGGVLDPTPTVLDAGWTAGSTVPTYFVLHIQFDGTIDVRWGTSLAAARAQAPTNIDPGFSADPTWCGFGLVACADNARGLVHFYDLFTHTPAGKQPLHWLAYRDPLEPGDPDMEEANRIIARKKQAHMSAAAVQTLVCICDEGTCDREPVG